MQYKSSVFATALALMLGLANGSTSAQETKQTEEQGHPPLGTASYTPPPGVKQQPLTTHSFAVLAAAANLAEIELGQLALSKSENPTVRQFAERMVKDHRAANAKLKAITATEQVSLPATPDDEHLTLKQKLSRLAGTQFDHSYLEAMTKDHAQAIALFEAAASSNQVSAELRAFANATLPTLKEHGKAVPALK
jgi:putative membrane protein